MLMHLTSLPVTLSHHFSFSETNAEEMTSFLELLLYIIIYVLKFPDISQALILIFQLL